MSTEKDCFKCEHCGMDMDMDPYCAHPEVTKKHKYGLVLHQVSEFCSAPEKKLFEPRKLR